MLLQCHRHGPNSSQRMSQRPAPADLLTRRLLIAGAAVPLLYFGVQLVAAPFYPGYSFLARDASTLGSPGSRFPAIFNLGSIVTGVVTLVATLGFYRAFRYLRIPPPLTWTTTFALVGSAIGSINAGVHPLPDPRHTSGILWVLGMGLLLLPFLLPVALWQVADLRSIRRYLVANLIVVAALIPVMSGLVERWIMMAGVELPGLQSLLNNYQGMLQRIAAIVVFVPIGITAAALARRLTTPPN